MSAYTDTGGVNDILEDVSPHTAIEEYFTPDMGLVIEAIVLRGIAKEGQVDILTIGKESITVSIR